MEAGNLSRKSVDTDVKLKELEKCLLRMDGARLVNTERYGEGDIDAGNFVEWARFARTLNNPDRIRNCLYYGFQPLYDSLITGVMGNGSRTAAVKGLNHIIKTSASFLTSYYLGKPDVKIFSDGIREIQSNLDNVGIDVPYRTKFRNIDRNGITPEGIHLFLKQFLEHVMDRKLTIPDYVIGCACGASEVAMPLAGVFGTDVGFLRKSKRRGDYKVFVVWEQEPNIKRNSEDANVVCVEDYVCTGSSIGHVMEKTTNYCPSSVLGASVNFVREGALYVQNIENTYKLNTFKLGHYPWK